MAYTVVYERENAAPTVRWKWYVARHEGRRIIRVREGAGPTQEQAADEAYVAHKQIVQEIRKRRER